MLVDIKMLRSNSGDKLNMATESAEIYLQNDQDIASYIIVCAKDTDMLSKFMMNNRNC